MAKIVHWHQAAEVILPHVVKITTPRGSGTGFLVAASATGSLVGIATAAHVVEHAHEWEQPIRITHAVSGKSVLLREADRAILGNWERDAAAIVFARGDLDLPTNALEAIQSTSHLKVGVGIGWLGYPGLVLGGPCFFSGRISLYRRLSQDYLVDGVAIPGVSGSPAFDIRRNAARLIGVLSAYIPNRLTGESLPGVSVVTDVSSLQSQIATIRSLGVAKKEEEAKAAEAQTPPPDGPSAPDGKRGKRRR